MISVLDIMIHLCISCPLKTCEKLSCLTYVKNWVNMEAMSSIEIIWTLGFAIREVKQHVYVKRQTPICTTWPNFLFICRLLFTISASKLVVLRNFLSIRIVLSCIYLPVFYFKKFSTWIWRLPFTWSLNSLSFPALHNMEFQCTTRDFTPFGCPPKSSEV